MRPACIDAASVPATLPALIARLALALLSLLPGWAAGAETALILAIHPYLAPSEIEQRFAPLAGILAGATGRRVTVRVGRDYQQHIDSIGQGSVDLAYIGPASLIALEDRYGRMPLLGRVEVRGQSLLHGYIVVRRDGPLRALSDLRGQRMVFVDRQSTMGYLVPRAVMARAGIAEADLRNLRFAGSHDNAALAVLTGSADAAAIKDESFEFYGPRGLRALAELPAVADHAFVASRRLDPQTRENVRRSLTGLATTAAGRAALDALRSGVTAVVAASSDDYQSLRTLLATEPNPAPAATRQR